MNPDATSAAAVRDSAPYGKACAGCSKAKCRCIPRGPGLKCERCDRLRKECQPSTVVRKRPSAAKRSAPRAPSAAQLGEKLDDLVTLLRERSQVDVVHRDASGTRQHGPPEGALPFSADGASNGQPRGRRGHWAETTRDLREPPATSPTTNYLTPHTTTSPFPQEPSPSQSEQYLRTFRENYLPMFPFVCIHPDTTAAQLQKEWPVLWLNIRALCCKSFQEQLVLERQVCETMAQKILVDMDRNMDMLLGLIAFLVCAFSGLAMALLNDLQLDRQTHDFHGLENIGNYGFPVKPPLSALNCTNEERRALLGCYVVTNSFSCFIKKPTAMKWTPYMEDCVQHLSQQPENEGDEVLVTIVRVSKILDDLIAASPWRLPTSEHIISYLLSTEVMIYELALYPVERGTVAPGFIDMSRTDCFYACLRAASQFLDNWFTFTPEEILGLPIPIHMQFNRCTQTLCRLSVLDDPAWDRAAVSGAVDLLATLEKCADLYSAVPSAIGLETDGGDTSNRYAAVLRRTVPIWRKAFEEAGVTSGTVGVGAGGEADGMSDVAAMDFSFEVWLNDSFSMFNTY
ncbi:uncharacterized protein DNG_04343 [Cephalotrichum gorgonifer]|uniref:Zn(2)-C6 fungal-type domain-containing protein n=1 Tax=Cephalotrichum gorgonifer TaxID=2041049 RepID=A0AAE8MWK8_9PEZI|nr:uncharacterized protein DNG_04343 [Cephalotrichum gorgonifer]